MEDRTEAVADKTTTAEAVAASVETPHRVDPELALMAAFIEFASLMDIDELQRVLSWARARFVSPRIQQDLLTLAAKEIERAATRMKEAEVLSEPIQRKYRSLAKAKESPTPEDRAIFEAYNAWHQRIVALEEGPDARPAHRLELERA